MIARIVRRVRLWRGRGGSAPTAPLLLDAFLAEWSAEAKRGGAGSDIAAAKAFGAKTAIMCLAPVQNRAIGWRGGR